MPIAWHELCLGNAKRTVAAERERAEAMLRSVARAEARLQFTENQITRAKEKGMDGFDADRFMKRRDD